MIVLATVPPAGRTHPDRPFVSMLALRAADGDDVAFARLCRTLDEFLHHHARRFYAAGLDHDDLVQEARIALHAACVAWDAHTVPFVPFAQMVIGRKLTDVLKATQRQKYAPLNLSERFEATASPHDDVQLTLADVIPGPWHHDPAHIAQARQDLATVIRTIRTDCSDTERAVVARRLNGDTLDQAGHGLGHSDRGPGKVADNAIQRARHKIEEALAA